MCPTINLVEEENSKRRSRIGIRSQVDWDNAMYSASVVLRAISVCSLEDHRMGQFAKVITYPVRDFTEMGSWASSDDHKPVKSASA